MLLLFETNSNITLGSNVYMFVWRCCYCFSVNAKHQCKAILFILRYIMNRLSDLLVNSGLLAVGKMPKKGEVVQGLTLHQVCLQTSFACSN